MKGFAALGVTIAPNSEDAVDVVDVWDVNWPTLLTFLACATQWRMTVGPAGPIWLGLDYAGVDVVLRRRGHEGDAVFADLRAMERAALIALHGGDDDEEDQG